MKKLTLAAAGAIGVAAVLLGGYRTTFSCVLGVRGTRASVTIQGLMASRRCHSFVQGNDDYYVRTALVTEPVLCEGDKDGFHYTVRDDGVMVLVGRMLCADIRRESVDPPSR